MKKIIKFKSAKLYSFHDGVKMAQLIYGFGFVYIVLATQVYKPPSGYIS
jgi:hypothetical protein